ncbi:hypothetical protein BC829DRAFT_416468 [Chytridium lagenaria]|nr:hypothetical protein BC829DRAFT_416468 [Chytridium lagenaria]
MPLSLPRSSWSPFNSSISDMLSPSSVPISEVSYDRSLTGMISVDGSTQGSPLFNTLDLNISSLMASPLFNPAYRYPWFSQTPTFDVSHVHAFSNASQKPEPLGSQIKGDGTSLLIAKAHITANAVDSLAEQVKSLTLKILPEAEAIKSIQRLEQAAGRDPLIGTNISITIAGLSGTSPSSGTGSATQSNRSYSPALSVKTDSSGGSSEGVTPNPSITVGARPIKVPKTKKKTGSGSKKPTYLQSRSKDGWHLQSYFKLDSNT